MQIQPIRALYYAIPSASQYPDWIGSLIIHDVCNKQFTKWKLLFARVIVMRLYLSTHYNGIRHFHPSIEDIHHISHLQECIVHWSIWIGLMYNLFCNEIIALATFHNDQKLLACLIKIIDA